MNTLRSFLVFYLVVLLFHTIRAEVFSVIMDKLKIVYVDPGFSSKFVAVVHRYNRTNKAFSGTVNLNKDLTTRDDLIIDAQGFAYVLNEYKPIPIEYHFQFCKNYNNIYNNLGNLVLYSNLPASCPIQKGSYHIKNYVPDLAMFQLSYIDPLWDRLMLYINGTDYKGRLLASIKTYAVVNEINEAEKIYMKLKNKFELDLKSADSVKKHFKMQEHSYKQAEKHVDAFLKLQEKEYKQAKKNFELAKKKGKKGLKTRKFKSYWKSFTKPIEV